MILSYDTTTIATTMVHFRNSFVPSGYCRNEVVKSFVNSGLNVRKGMAQFLDILLWRGGGGIGLGAHTT